MYFTNPVTSFLTTLLAFFAVLALIHIALTTVYVSPPSSKPLSKKLRHQESF